MIEMWAEAGPCDNSVDKALEYVEAIHSTGANAIKVQWYNADTLVIPDVGRYDNTGGPALTQHDMFKNAIYPYSRWDPVIDLCRSLNLRFIPSVFDLEAVDYANEKELPVLKLASGDLTYHELLRAASEGRQVAMSTGAATLPEVESAVEQLTPGEHILMACHLQYPTAYHDANIARTHALQLNFPHMIPGFSDHTPGIDTIPLIVATGCQVIEKHFTLEQGKGYDSDFALSIVELRNAVNKIQGTVAVMGDADINPDLGEQAARAGARRSPYAAHDIPANKVLERDDLAILRPFYGPEPWEVYSYVGRSYGKDIPKGGRLPN